MNKILLVLALSTRVLFGTDLKIDTYELAKSCNNGKKQYCEILEKLLVEYDKSCVYDRDVKKCILNAVAFYALDKEKYKNLFFYYYEKSCSFDGDFSSFACNVIAGEYVNMYFDENQKYFKDYFIEQAKHYFETGCKKNNRSSCDNVNMIENGKYKDILNKKSLSAD